MAMTETRQTAAVGSRYRTPRPHRTFDVRLRPDSTSIARVFTVPIWGHLWSALRGQKSCALPDSCRAALWQSCNKASRNRPRESRKLYPVRGLSRRVGPITPLVTRTCRRSKASRSDHGQGPRDDAVHPRALPPAASGGASGRRAWRCDHGLGPGCRPGTRRARQVHGAAAARRPARAISRPE